MQPDEYADLAAEPDDLPDGDVDDGTDDEATCEVVEQ
jgi:hypothetical protein